MLPFSTQRMSTLSVILLPGHKDEMKSVRTTAQQQLNLDTWDFLRETEACSSSTISKKDKRQQHRQLMGLWATIEPCFIQHAEDESEDLAMPR